MSIAREPLYRSRPVGPEFAKVETVRVNDFVTMSEGASNAYLIETEEGNIQLNAGMFFEAPIHKKGFDAVSSAPLRYLILTQGHTDHVGGVAYFREKNPGLELIATAGNQEHQSYDRRLAPFRGARSAFAFRDKIGAAVEYAKAHSDDPIPAQDIPVPDITFEDRHAFELGGLEVELIAVPGAETNDSLVVWLPQHKIVFTGNLFGCPFGHIPNLVTIRGDRYRDALTCAEAVQTVLDLGAETICYGHHAPIEGGELIREELTTLRDATLYMHDETVKGMNAGKDVHTLMREIALPPELEVGQGYGKLAWSVRAIWEAYAGWFHHESTTELYAVPRSAVHADLIELAGGADALIVRAREKVAAGELEQATHLLDIVLSEDARNPAALGLAIDVHETLLAASENFWLSAWLTNQIREMRTRLG